MARELCLTDNGHRLSLLTSSSFILLLFILTLTLALKVLVLKPTKLLVSSTRRGRGSPWFTTLLFNYFSSPEVPINCPLSSFSQIQTCRPLKTCLLCFISIQLLFKYKFRYGNLLSWLPFLARRLMSSRRRREFKKKLGEKRNLPDLNKSTFNSRHK